MSYQYIYYYCGLVYQIDKYEVEYRVTVFEVLHFVKRFVWFRSVFTQYSYYCDFFYSGPASRICDSHWHRWVRYIGTTNITAWCTPSLLLSIDLQLFCYFIMFCFKLSQNLSFLTNNESVPLFYFEHNILAADKVIHNLQYFIPTNKYRNKVYVIKPS